MERVPLGVAAAANAAASNNNGAAASSSVSAAASSAAAALTSGTDGISLSGSISALLGTPPSRPSSSHRSTARNDPCPPGSHHQPVQDRCRICTACFCCTGKWIGRVDGLKSASTDGTQKRHCLFGCRLWSRLLRQRPIRRSSACRQHLWLWARQSRMPKVCDFFSWLEQPERRFCGLTTNRFLRVYAQSCSRCGRCEHCCRTHRQISAEALSQFQSGNSTAAEDVY